MYLVFVGKKMLQVTILMVGKTREAFIRQGLAFYQKRLQPFLNLTLTSVREEKEAGGLNAEPLKGREGERLRAKIPPRAWVTALTPEGREYTSEEFAVWLTQRELTARPLAFLVGGHWGLSDGVIANAHERLALSRLTLPHELARLVLLEQLYRAMTIKTGHPYHV
ncbi:MAG: 23S rRNA (pseudouridine(1915)-N(3))-methyltransferase RlmH [Thermodesulfobacteriota bacterium]